MAWNKRIRSNVMTDGTLTADVISNRGRRPWGDLIGQQNDLFLVALIIAVIALMVLPLAPWAIDALIALNLTISVTILMVALYIGTPLGLSTFPSLLLFTTLFRLSLNIASTRQILLHANAGEVIRTFGRLVVGGDVIVGLVVFLIIAIVQFIVISKGSERVAEVAARFTLDAMPGKQMSIDADLRAGLVNKEEARARRLAVENESQLYGAMDGAMKFVKGDAIASIIIAAVNVLGGVAIGVLRKDMAIGAALHKYSVLSVGDALVSQIPSLFVSVAAGVVITRVSRHETGASNLGNDIARQIKAHPKAMLLAGGVIAAMAGVPGLPAVQFLMLGGAVLFAGWQLTPERQRIARGRSACELPSLKREGSSSAPRYNDDAEHALTVPLSIRLAQDVADAIDPGNLNVAMQKVREQFALACGNPFPGAIVKTLAGLPPGTIRIDVFEIPATTYKVRTGGFVSAANVKQLQDANIPFEIDQTGRAWISQEHRSSLIEKAIEFATLEEMVAETLRSTITRCANEFLGVQETQFLLKRLESGYPELERELRQHVPIARLTDVLRRLLIEGLSVRDMVRIAQALVEYGSREKDNGVLVEHVRTALASQITHQYASSDRRLTAVILAPDLEDELRQGLRQSTARYSLTLSELQRNALVSQIGQALANPPQTGASPVLLVHQPEIRSCLREELSLDFPGLAVLAAHQLEAHVHVLVIAEVSVDK